MRWCKIPAGILLMLSVIDIALAAPVPVKEHQVRVSVVDAAKDGTGTSSLRRDPSDKWLANAADRTNAPPIPIPRSSDSGDWREQEPRQHKPRSGTDSIGSPEPSNSASNPASLSESTPLKQGPSHDDIDLNFNPQSSSQGFKSLSEPMSTTTRVTPPPDGSPQIASSPDSNFNPQSKSQPFKSLSELMSTPTHDIAPPDGSPQIASSPDEFYSSSSWVPTDSHSGSTSSESWSPQYHDSPPASSLGLSQDHVPSLSSAPIPDTPPLDGSPQIVSSPDSNFNPQSKSQPFKSLSELMSTPTHDTVPPDGSPQITSSSDESYSSSSWAPTDSHSSSTSSDSWSPQDSASSPDQLSTDESHPSTLGPTDNDPPPASSSNPGPSTEPNPPPSAKRPRPEEHGFGSFLSKIAKGKFKRRFSGSGALNAVQGDLQGTFNSGAYVTASSLLLLSTNDRSEHSDVLINH